MKKILIIACSLTLVILGYFLLSPATPGKKIQPLTPAGFVSAEGKVEFMDGCEVEVGSEMEGRIAEFYVDEGSIIRKGDIIAELANHDIKAKLKETEAARETIAAELDFARKSFYRYKTLYDQGYVAREQMEEKETSLNVLNSKARETEAASLYYRDVIDKTIIRAPISGSVIRKYLQKGETITREMKTALLAIADLHRIWINTDVDETDIGRIAIGDLAEVTSDAYPGKTFKGEVVKLADYVGIRKFKPTAASRNIDMKVIQVKIKITDANPFKPGMTVDVKIKPGKV